VAYFSPSLLAYFSTVVNTGITSAGNGGHDLVSCRHRETPFRSLEDRAFIESPSAQRCGEAQRTALRRRREFW